MEVFCEPPVYLKAHSKGTAEKLHLTNIDQVFNYYRCIMLAYTSCNSQKLSTVEVADDAAEAVRCGTQEMVNHYRWAAGRIQVAPHGIDGHRLEVCVDEDGGLGVQFVSARANCALAHLSHLDDPSPAFEPLFATVTMNGPLHARPLVALQVTTFEDGGVCISMNLLHSLFDGVAASTFLQNIASCARKEGVCTPMDEAPRELRIKPVMVPLRQRGWPCFLQQHFAKDFTTEHQAFMQPLAATRFSLSQEELAQLQFKALSEQQDCGSGFKACSRFQALAAHLWKAKAQSLICSRAPSEAFPLRIAVNVRGRIVASIPLSYMGNALSFAIASATLKELTENSLAFAVEKIQEAVQQVTSEHFQAAVDYVEMLGGSARLLPACMAITSLVGLGFYKADFGWGKPAYVGNPYKQRRNLVVISEGDAEYTFVNVFAVFDSQVELQKFQDALKSM